MGNTELEARGNGVEASKEASYSVISYKGSELPEQYYNMVLSKWLRTLKYGCDYYKLIASDPYFSAYTKYIKILLNRPNTIIRLAVLSDDKDVVLGWSAVEGPALHYVWVESNQRNQGIATALIPKQFDYITHITNSGVGMWHKKFPKVQFNPFF